MSEPCGLGVDVGWLGFPALYPASLCFFSGAVSARLEYSRTYLIDGVAIHGVSGGPVFHTSHSGEPQIIGCVSAYHANRAAGETLPGLLRAQDVSHFHGVAAHVNDIAEANQRKAEFEAAQKAKEEAAAVPVQPSAEAGTAPEFDLSP